MHLRESIGAMMCVCVSEAHAYEVIDEGLMYLFSNVFLSVKAHEKLWVEVAVCICGMCVRRRISSFSCFLRVMEMPLLVFLYRWLYHYCPLISRTLGALMLNSWKAPLRCRLLSQITWA